MSEKTKGFTLNPKNGRDDSEMLLECSVHRKSSFLDTKIRKFSSPIFVVFYFNDPNRAQSPHNERIQTRSHPPAFLRCVLDFLRQASLLLIG